MSEIPNMISALVDDNKIDAESHFKGAMAQKIGAALDLKRVEVANSLVKGQQSHTSDTEETADETV